ncbi:MAG: YceI family protein [Niabella sp.]
MKKLLCLALVFGVCQCAEAQKKYFTKTGILSFEASTPLETINPVNKSATSVVDITTGQIEFAVLIKGFEFDKALMQEHFNENYMESSKYPKSVFKGTITNLQSIHFSKDGTYPATVKGYLEIHGVKKEITVTGAITISGTTIKSVAQFNVLISDYNISIPGIVRDKISKTATVKVNCTYAPLK